MAKLGPTGTETVVDAFMRGRSILASPIFCATQAKAYNTIEMLKGIEPVDRIEQLYELTTERAKKESIRLPSGEIIPITTWQKKKTFFRVENSWIAIDPQIPE